MSLFDQVDAARARWDVLEHPFYLRWSDGELSREDLAVYAGQYRHAVVALADGSRAAAERAEGGARGALEAHAAEEAEHVEVWDRFASAVGAGTSAAPTAETRDCVRAWSGSEDRGLVASLVALYAIESSQPRISEVKRAGLVEHYGFDAGSDATAYFDLHARRDHAHAAQHRRLILNRPRGERDTVLAVDAAERVLAGNWALLDGVERSCGRPVEPHL